MTNHDDGIHMADTSHSGHTSARSVEHGFGLVELVVAAIVVSILGAVVTGAFMHSRRTAATAKISVTAQAYAEAIDGYAQDHAGAIPVPGQDGWRVLAAGPTASVHKNGALVDLPYMKGAPEAVQSGDVAITAGTAGSVPVPTSPDPAPTTGTPTTGTPTTGTPTTGTPTTGTPTTGTPTTGTPTTGTPTTGTPTTGTPTTSTPTPINTTPKPPVTQLTCSPGGPKNGILPPCPTGSTIDIALS